MADENLTIDCSTGVASRRELTTAEAAAKQRFADASAEFRAAADAKANAQAAAVTQLKAKAKTDPNLALVCQAMGIDPNS